MFHLTGWQPIRLLHNLSCDTVALYHCVHGKSLFVVVFAGPCPFRFLLCFSAGWRNANLAGGSACRLLFGCFCVLFWVFDLPCYMTTGVNVEFISNCFFTCKDRALERDRPYQRKKCKQSQLTLVLSLTRGPAGIEPPPVVCQRHNTKS